MSKDLRKNAQMSALNVCCCPCCRRCACGVSGDGRRQGTTKGSGNDGHKEGKHSWASKARAQQPRSHSTPIGNALGSLWGRFLFPHIPTQHL